MPELTLTRPNRVEACRHKGWLAPAIWENGRGDADSSSSLHLLGPILRGGRSNTSVSVNPTRLGSGEEAHRPNRLHPAHGSALQEGQRHAPDPERDRTAPHFRCQEEPEQPSVCYMSSAVVSRLQLTPASCMTSDQSYLIRFETNKENKIPNSVFLPRAQCTFPPYPELITKRVLTEWQHRGQRVRSGHRHGVRQDCLGALRTDHKQPRGMLFSRDSFRLSPGADCPVPWQNDGCLNAVLLV